MTALTLKGQMVLDGAVLEKLGCAACHFVAVRCWIYFELLMSLFVKAVSACAEIVHFTDGKTVGNTSKFC